MAVREPTTAARASRLPDLLIIGTAKAGTTALFGALSQHPRVFAPPVKEPLFLAYAGNPPHFAGPAGDRLSHRVISDLPTYQALFDGCPPDAMAFEATPEYLYSRTAPMAALEYVPDARLVAVIRHPVERAFSHYLHLLHEGLETLSFEAAWAAEEERIASGWAPVWHYRARGFYGEQLRRWLDVFPAEQMLVLLYEEWLESPGATLDRICAHAGIEPFESFTPRRENVSSLEPRWRWLHHRMVEDNRLRRWAGRRLPLSARDAITRGLGALNLRPGPSLDPALRARLAVAYRDDVTLVEEITGRDLTAWRS